MRSSKKTCILGGAIQVDTETQKHVYLALQMGSDLVINKLYPAINGSDSLVKGAFNLVKSGDKVCQHMNDLGNLYHSYDNNITNGLTDDQATSLFAIEFMASILKGVDDLGIYSWLEIEDLINGLKDVINLSKGIDKFYSEYINPDLSITLNEPFFNWNNIFSLSVPVDITLTTVFKYKVDGIALEKFSLKTAEKIFTNKDNIEIFTKKLGTVNSDGGKIKIDSLGLKMGLYIITASTTDGKEVYRDTVHLVTTKQKHTMTINRY